jgi:hypothetical protein
LRFSSIKTARPVPGFKTLYISAIYPGQTLSGTPPVSDLKINVFNRDIPALEVINASSFETQSVHERFNQEFAIVRNIRRLHWRQICAYNLGGRIFSSNLQAPEPCPSADIDYQLERSGRDVPIKDGFGGRGAKILVPNCALK